MKLIKTTLIISTLIFSASGMAIDKTAGGAIAGAAIGAAGKDVKSTVGGAVVGAGTGAMFKSGDKGKAARKGGAVVLPGACSSNVGKSVPKGAVAEQVPVR